MFALTEANNHFFHLSILCRQNDLSGNILHVTFSYGTHQYNVEAVCGIIIIDVAIGFHGIPLVCQRSREKCDVHLP